MADGLDVPESAVDRSSQHTQQQLSKAAFALVAGSTANLSILAAQSPFNNYPETSLPFPLNLPPSYPIYRGQASALLRRPPSTISSQGASATAGRAGKNPSRTSTPAPAPVEFTARPAASTSSVSKGKRSLDAFMQSRQATQSQTESEDSDSDTSLRKVLVNRWQTLQSSDSTRVLSSSPPSSSPVQTPRESSPIHPTLPVFSHSPSPRPKRQAMMNARAGPSSSASSSAIEAPYTLPPGPYFEERPVWSLAALIGQAIAASFAGALPLNDIYTFISTVYPYFDRRDQAWMSSIRHSLSVNEAFERVYDQDGTAAKKVKCKGKTRLKGGFWRIRPGFEDCFAGGNFVRKGAKGSGPGMNSSSKKRSREEDGSQRSQKAKTTGRGMHNRSNSNIETTVTGRMNSRIRSQSSPEPVVRKSSPPLSSSPPPLSASQSTYPSDSLLSDTYDSTSPAPRNSLDPHRKFQCAPTNILAKLEAGFELQNSPNVIDRNKPAKILNSQDMSPNVLRHLPSISLPSEPFFSSRPDSPSRCKTPPYRPISPSRTPISYKGIQMSPSLSLAHYKNSLEPEWKTVLQPSTPPPGGSNYTPFATPQRLIFPRPFRTPSKHYDPYDPETLLADELAIARQSRELGESPGGIFGKEGRKLLYESPSVPGKSDWRFTNDEF